MADLPIAEVLKTPNGSSSSQTVTTGSGTAAGDTLIIGYASDFYDIATMPNPTSSAGTPTPVGSVDIGSTFGHIKGYILPVTSAGAKTVTFPPHTDCDIFGVVIRISATVTVNGTPTSQFDTSNTLANHVAAGVTTTSPDAMLICCWLKTNAGSGWTGEQYSIPAMTKRAEAASSPFAAFAVATETIASPGATGTRTATWFEPKVYGSISFAVAGSSSDTPISVADAGSEAEALTVAAATPLAQSAAGADTLTTSATVPLSQAGAAAEALTTAASVSLADAGSAAEALTVTRPLALPDAASAADGLTVTASVALADAGTAADSFSTGSPVPVADAGAGSDQLAVAAAVPLADSGSAANALTVAGTVALTDTGMAGDGLAVSRAIPLADAAASTQALAVTTIAPLVDAGSSAEQLTVAAALNLADSGAAADSLASGQPIALADSGSAVEALAVTVTTALTDQAAAVEALAAAVNAALADAGLALDMLTAAGPPPEISAAVMSARIGAGPDASERDRTGAAVTGGVRTGAGMTANRRSG